MSTCRLTKIEKYLAEAPRGSLPPVARVARELNSPAPTQARCPRRLR